VLVSTVGYPAAMRRRIRTRWVVVAFVLLGVLIALILIVRDLGDDSDVPEETGTVPAHSGAARSPAGTGLG
jgi:hypothetical protein